MKLMSPLFDENEVELVREALQSGWVTQGPFVTKFEQRFSEFQNCEHAIATTSCTAALHLAMAALSIGPGDEVIVPSFTWVTSAHCAEYMGAKAVFVDVDPNTFNIDPVKIEAAITPRTKAIVAVHLFGLAAEMSSIIALAKEHDLFVVEDGACALGTTYEGSSVGVLGDVGCFSFHPRKAITTGEGGMVTTANGAIAATLKSLRNHGCIAGSSRPEETDGPWTMNPFPNLGFNLRMSDIQAAVGVAQFDKASSLLQHRRACASSYSKELSTIEALTLPTSAPDAIGHSYQSYVIRLAGRGRTVRNNVMQALKDAGIDSRPGTHCAALTEFYRNKYDLQAEQFPVGVSLEDETITLPLFPGMTEDDIDKVVSVLRKAVS